MSTHQPPGSPDPSTPVPPSAEAATPPEKEDRPSTWQPLLYLKIGLLLFAIAYSIAFVVENTEQIPIDFVFWTAEVRLIWEILLLLGLGVVGGILLSQLYRHRRRARLSKQPGQSRHAGADVGRRDKAVGKTS